MAHIFQLNASNGGVPKLPLREAAVDVLGLTTDKQKHTKFHGGPERALCLYALERIVALQAEGHPIYPGAVGENVTLAGVDWERVAPGTRLRLGAAVVVEITSFAVPCKQITAAFADGQSKRISQTLHPGWARTYARVLSEGVLRVGDPIEILTGETETT